MNFYLNYVCYNEYSTILFKYKYVVCLFGLVLVDKSKFKI